MRHALGHSVSEVSQAYPRPPIRYIPGFVLPSDALAKKMSIAGSKAIAPASHELTIDYCLFTAEVYTCLRVHMPLVYNRYSNHGLATNGG